MSNNTYYIFRHGETFSTRDKIPYGNKQDTSILPEGVEPIKRLAKYLEFAHTDYNYTSELNRCIQTSQIVTDEIGKEFSREPLLNEYLEDSFAGFHDRIKNLTDRFLREKGKTFLICTHGAVISALKHLLIYGEYTKEDLMDFPVPGTLMIINNSGSELLDFNVE